MMSQKEDRRTDDGEVEEATLSVMDRRNFLKLSTTATVGALTLAACNSDPEVLTPPVAQQSGTNTPPPPTPTPVPTRTPDEEQSFLKGLTENWGEPMSWRVGDWPGQQLDLNAVIHSTPLAILGFNAFDIGSNPNLNPDGTDLLFSFNGIAPGPTIRMRGDETLYVKLRNLLPLNAGTSMVPIPLPDSDDPFAFYQLPVKDWCLGEHVNGVHSTHTTNMHTHGLHVRPGRNPDGTHSDNIFLRILPQADWVERESSDDPSCNFIQMNEQVAQADYEFRLGNVGADFLQNNPKIAEKLGYNPDDVPYPHPDGSFWYHPHPHGATYFQVSGGMAGFLIVEGVTDDAIRSEEAMNAPRNAIFPDIPDGPFNFRERQMLIQRIQVQKDNLVDPDAPQPGSRAINNTAFQPIVNGSTQRLNITMTPGTVERWRILNGSVDSYGYVRIFVLKGDFETIDDPSSPYFGQVAAPDGVSPLTDPQLQETAAQTYFLLAADGITLVNDPNAPVRYENPLDGGFGDMGSVRYTLQRIAPENEPVLLAVANRADLLFQAPASENTRNGKFDVYTIVARGYDDVTDRIANQISRRNGPSPRTFPPDTIIARLIVSGDDVDPSQEAMGKIFDALAPEKAPVQPYLYPVIDEELKLTEAEMKNRVFSAPDGTTTPLTGDWYRKRRVRYSGWGGGYPYGDAGSTVVEGLQAAYPVEQRNTTTVDDTMAIDGLKFNPDLAVHAMNRDTAEEWVLENCSMTLYGVQGSGTPSVDPRVWRKLPENQVLTTREDYAAPNPDDPTSSLFPVGNAVDHPFHIHQNPFWVTQRWTVDDVEIDGEETRVTLKRDPNWIPRWHDVMHIPRNGGRIVFRSRFWDFVGLYVNHCHLLLHEDNGMMQPVQVLHEDGEIAVEANRGQVTFATTPDGSGTVENIEGLLANYNVVRLEGLTDTAANETMTSWTSDPDQPWPPASTRRDCFLQNQTALDTSVLPVDPQGIRARFPEQRSQGLGMIDDFLPTPVPPATPTPTPPPTATPSN